MSFTRHLLVDGANILNAWPDLRALLKRDRDAARSQLVQRLAVIHDSEEVRVTLVFDGKGEELTIERPSGQPTFSIIYTPSSLTADDVIEQLVGKAENASTCAVATDDHAERETIQAAGAEALRPDDLLAWVARAETRQRANVDQVHTAAQRGWSKS